MKNITNDTKYIIKRILIGVGIAIVLFNLKKCNVYALSTENFYYPNSGKVPVHGTYSTTSPGFYYEFNTTQYSLGELAVNFRLRNLSVFRPNSFVIFKNKNNNNVFILPVDGSPTDYNISLNSNNEYCQDSSQNNTCTNTTFNELIQLVPQNGSPNISGGATSFTNSATGTTFYYGFNSPYSSSLNFTTDYEVVDTNITNLTINDIDWQEFFSPNPLADYTEIDITGKEAILIVPKNYLQLSNTDYEYIENGDKHYILYKYGVERCVKPTLINMKDFDKFFIYGSWNQDFLEENSLHVAEQCFDIPTLQSIKSLYTSSELQATTDDPYNYMALLIYNNSIIYDNNSQNWINNQNNPYGANSVWVNTNLYNYYLVDNLNTFNQAITYKNSNGDDETINIESLPTFTDLMEEQKNQNSIDDYTTTRQKIDYLFSLVKLPFTFLQNIISGTCQPLTAPFPHSNSNLVFPCLSLLYEDILGTEPYQFVQFLLNGLLCYRVLISLILFTEKNLDPSDSKLEVLDL